MKLHPVVVQPLGIYRNADTLRRCRNVFLSSTLSWVTMSFQTERSPCPLLTVGLEVGQVRELRDYLTGFLDRTIFDWEGRER